MSVLQGEDGVRFTVEAQGQMMGAALSSLPAALATARAEAVVLDAYQYYVEVIPMSLGLPYVHVSNALYLDYSGYTPLYVYDWPHETTPAALARNRKGMAHFVRMLKQANAIADKQTGVVNSLDKLTTEHLSTLLDDVLSDPSVALH